MIHLIEAAVCLVVSYYASRFWLRRAVLKRLCPHCDGTGRWVDPLGRGRPCHACYMSGTRKKT